VSSNTWALYLFTSGSRLAVADADHALHVLTKSSSDNEEVIFDFGGGLSGHQGKITGMEYCGGHGEDGARYVATISGALPLTISCIVSEKPCCLQQISDDKTLMVWDLSPAIELETSPMNHNRPRTPPERPQPTAYVIPFPYPLTAVISHPSSSKEFLVADSHGSVYLTDWRTDPLESGEQSWRHHSLVQLIEPRVVADTMSGKIVHGGGSIAWCRDVVDMYVSRAGACQSPAEPTISVGAVYGSTLSIWDIAKLQGGKPQATGTIPEGGQHLR
jgi:hypothetical protein